MINLTFLGTSCMVPTKERNVAGIFLEHEGKGFLIDCGEGTQRQMNIAGINRTKIDKILISHWHGDHVSGLIGIIQTIGNSFVDELEKNEIKEIEIIGPDGSKKFMENLLKSCYFDVKVDLKVKEVSCKKPCLVSEGSAHEIWAVALEHGVPCLGFSFVEKDKFRMDIKKLEALNIPQGILWGKLQVGKAIEFEGRTIHPEDVTIRKKGKQISFVSDTSFCNSAVEISREADLVISEAAYLDELYTKAEKNHHLTARQAATIAKNADAKQLILTHFSQRYKQVDEFEEEAKEIFENTICAKDFMTLKI